MNVARLSVSIALLLLVSAFVSPHLSSVALAQGKQTLPIVSESDLAQIFQLSIQLEFGGQEPPAQTVVILNPGLSTPWKPDMVGWRFDVVDIGEFRRRAAGGELCYFFSDITLRRAMLDVSFLKVTGCDADHCSSKGTVYAFRKSDGTWTGAVHGSSEGVEPLDDDDPLPATPN